MLFVLIVTYLGVWGCAHVAAHRWPGRCGFWVFYAVAVALVPVVSGLAIHAIFGWLAPDYAATITPLSVQVGAVVALVAYPVKHLRARGER